MHNNKYQGLASAELSPQQLEKAAIFLKALSHPIRLSILQVVEQLGRVSVGEFCNLLGYEQSLVSHHLGHLRNKGILKDEREGQHVFYSLKIKELIGLLRCVENCKTYFA